MKRSFLFFTSAIAFGALSGFLISDASKLAKVPPSVATILPKARQAAPVQAEKVAPTAFGRFIDSTVAAVSPSHARKSLPVGSLVLNQPVVVVQGGARPYATIPQGTAVSLVKNEGKFMSVRHDQSVLTIPRSAVGIGVVRSN